MSLAVLLGAAALVAQAALGDLDSSFGMGSAPFADTSQATLADPDTSVIFRSHTGPRTGGCAGPTCRVTVHVRSFSDAPVHFTVARSNARSRPIRSQTEPPVFERTVGVGSFDIELPPGRYEHCFTQPSTATYESSSGCHTESIQARWRVTLGRLKLGRKTLTFTVKATGDAVGQDYDIRTLFRYTRANTCGSGDRCSSDGRDGRLRRRQTFRIRLPDRRRPRRTWVRLRIDPGHNDADTVSYGRLLLDRYR